MVERKDISRETIHRLTGILVDMAKDSEEFRSRWESTLCRDPMARNLANEGDTDTAIAFLAEPYFEVIFRRLNDAGRTHVVELEIGDRNIRHAWSRASLENIARTV